MAHRKQPPHAPSARPPPLAAVNRHAAGLDGGAEAHVVAVPPSDEPPPGRWGGASTLDWESWADWGAACGGTTVALEATGVSGSPLFELLARRALAVLPVEPQPGPKIKGRPTSDVHDGQGLPRLQTFGLLAGAFRPPAQVGVRRSDLRLDRGRWPPVKPCPSWLGRCPHHRVSGGTGWSRGTRPWANRAATALRLAASCLQRRQSARGAFFRRMKARLGTPKAITAPAPTLARLISTMLTHGTAYVRQRLADSEQHDRDRMIQHLTRRATALG